MDPVIVGIDEAGRGAIAGPVVAGACMMQPELITHPLIQDSKKLYPDVREEAFEWIIANCEYGIGIVDAPTVDEIGILSATELAMQESVANLSKSVTPTYLLVDGKDKFWFDYPHSSVIKGDEKERCIAAASILAKVTRDRCMMDISPDFIGYGFEQHKGYGTPEHLAAVRKNGVTNMHRKSFLGNMVKTSAVRTPSPPQVTAK